MRDGTENGSFVHMIHSLQKSDQKNVKKVRFILNHRDSALWLKSEKKKDLLRKRWIPYINIWKRNMVS